MKFRSFSSKPAARPSPAGCSERTMYSRKVVPGGVSELVEAGKENLYQRIQLAAQGNLVLDLIRRAERGDLSAILPVDAPECIVDITNAPTSLMDAENKLIQARSFFDSLPLEVRNKYGNNFNTFLSAVDDGSYLSDAVGDAKARQEALDNKKAVEASVPPFTKEQLDFIQQKINFGGNS